MAKILVIDDDDQVRLMLRHSLEENGYDVCTASDGKEGVRRYHEDPADLVITDIIMPEQEGIETIIELRRDFPGVKIIAISGGGRGNKQCYLDIAKRVGALSAFEKPIDRKELLDAVAGLIGHSTPIE